MAYYPYEYHEGIEPRYVRYIPSFMEINSTTVEEIKLIRLFLGTISVEHPLSGDLFQPKNNLSVVGMPENSPVSSRIIRNQFSTPRKLDRLESFINETKYLNRKFCQELLNELTQYFHATENDSHTKAFLHIYRMTEFIGYSFPLIYASSSRNYYGTFNRLKNYFSTSKSELTFFDSFIDSLFTDNTPETLVTFNLGSSDLELNKSHYRILDRIIKDDYVNSKTPDTSITITYRHLLNVCVDVRNRYFHFGMGAQRNIHATEILEPDVFFKTVNSHIINWIGVIYFEILASQI